MKERRYIKLLIIFIVLFILSMIIPLTVRAKNAATYTTFASSGDTHAKADEIRKLFGRDFSRNQIIASFHQMVLIQVIDLPNNTAKAFTDVSMIYQPTATNVSNMYARFDYNYTVPEDKYTVKKCRTIRFKVAIAFGNKNKVELSKKNIESGHMTIGINDSSNKIIRNEGGAS